MAAEQGDNVWFEDLVVSCNRRVLLGGSILRNAWFFFIQMNIV